MYGVTQIDVCEDVAVVTLTNMPLSLSVAVKAFGQMASTGVNIDMISQTSPVGDRVSISFTCPDRDLLKVLDIAKGIKKSHPKVSSLVSSGNAKLSLYGEEMREEAGVFARAIRALDLVKVEPQLITTSEIDISLLVSAASLPAAKDVLREAFEI